MYVTEDSGDVYFLDIKDSHSQWDDPRESGIVYHSDSAYNAGKIESKLCVWLGKWLRLWDCVGAFITVLFR